jgi:hypothetical protein
MTSACLEAHRLTGARRWLDRARVAFDWFVGDNELHAPVYDAGSGGCRDGLHADRVNENQGAESTLSFLLALTEMRAADRAAATNGTGKANEPYGQDPRIRDAVSPLRSQPNPDG